MDRPLNPAFRDNRLPRRAHDAHFLLPAQQHQMEAQLLHEPLRPSHLPGTNHHPAPCPALRGRRTTPAAPPTLGCDATAARVEDEGTGDAPTRKSPAVKREQASGESVAGSKGKEPDDAEKESSDVQSSASRPLASRIRPSSLPIEATARNRRSLASRIRPSLPTDATSLHAARFSADQTPGSTPCSPGPCSPPPGFCPGPALHRRRRPGPGRALPDSQGRAARGVRIPATNSSWRTARPAHPRALSCSKNGDPNFFSASYTR